MLATQTTLFCVHCGRRQTFWAEDSQILDKMAKDEGWISPHPTEYYCSPCSEARERRRERRESERFDRWPLGINPEMDKHAQMHELSHWSCVSPQSNEWWVRRDGQQHACFTRHYTNYPDDLRVFDREYPMERSK